MSGTEHTIGASSPHAVVISAVYAPEPQVSAQMSRDLAHELAARGMRVTVLCPPPSRPLGTVHRAEDISRDRPSGPEANPRVVTLLSYVSPRSRLLGRLCESWSFGRRAAEYLRSVEPAPSVVYANTWPLPGQLLPGRACARRAIPYILHVQDMYPEALLHRLPTPLRRLLGAPLLALDRAIARLAHRVLLISPSAERHYGTTRGLPRRRLTVLRNWADETPFAVMPDRSSASAEYGIPAGPFIFLYLGNIGPLAGVEHLIKAFASARPPGAKLVIAGDGDRREACRQLARQLDLDSVFFVSDPRTESTPRLLAVADVCLLPLRPGASLGSVPSKLIAYMLAGKPVLAAVDSGSDTAAGIAEADCGWVVAPDDSGALAEAFVRVVAIPVSERERMGAAGRTYGLRHFSRMVGLELLTGIIRSAAVQTIFPLAPGHVEEAVRLHLDAFPGFFLSQLGRRFVRELYRGYAAGPEPQGLVALDASGRLVGVLLGASDPQRFYRRLLLRRGWAFALAGLPALIRRPAIGLRLLRAVRYRGVTPSRLPGALLSSLAVSPRTQGRGVGRRLVEAWLERVQREGGERAWLTTDADENEPVNRFYRRLGWKLEAAYTTPEDRRMHLYGYTWLPPNDCAPP